MSEKRLIERITPQFESAAAAKRAVEAVLEGIKEEVGSGEMVIIRGFGTFKKKVRAERVARNPRTGEVLGKTPEKTILFMDSKHTF